jgi:3D (Asp-Asp-Asp) domain-containing protein
LSLILQNSGAPVAGTQIHLTSSRGGLDAIAPAGTITTGSVGKATASVSTRAQPGQSTITASDAGIKTATPGVISWLPAKYEGDFLVTCYPIANEAEWPSSPVTQNVCGLPSQNVYRTQFLGDTKMQGSGKALDGSFIHYNQKTNCYNVDTCARTATGACATAGKTIASDFTVIPKRSSVNVAIIGQRQAQDVGDRIKGYHIDEFVGPIPRQACLQVGHRHSAITFLHY